MLKGIIYGETGVGCSTLARTVENADFLCIEEFESMKDLAIAFKNCATSENKYVIIDDMTKLDKMINNYTAVKNGKNHIEEFPYNGGYKLASITWENILHQLDKINKNIIFVAHATMDKIDSPILGSYSRYDLAVNQYIKETLKIWADEVWFYQNNLVISRFLENEGHLLHSNNNAAFFAKTKHEPKVLNAESLIKNFEHLNNLMPALVALEN